MTLGFSGSSRRRQLPLAVVPLVAVAVVPVTTALLVWLGPDARNPGADSQIRDQLRDTAWIEPTDRMVLASWWLAAAVLIAVSIVGLRSTGSRRRGALRPATLWGLVVPGFVLLVAGIVARDDAFGVVPSVGLTPFVVGVAVVVGLIVLADTGVSWRRFTTASVVITVVAILCPYWIQLPGRLADPVHARVAIDDVSAVGVGLVPLHDFFPQYTVLLGYPVGLLTKVFPAIGVALAVWWLVALQALAVIVAVAVVAWAWGRRYLAAAAVIVPALAFASGPNGLFPFSYLQTNPMRIVLPAITIGVACRVLARTRVTVLWSWVAVLALGFLCGATVLNNPDFGAPAFVSVWLTCVIVMRGRRLVGWLAVPIGSAAAFGVYSLLLWATGNSAHWNGWLIFPNIFGRAGLVNVPMSAIGWHVAGATLFISAAVAGWLILASSSGVRGGRHRRQGLALFLVSVWSLLTLPYFVGRSLTATFLGSYAFQIGWTAACLFPLVVAGWRCARRAGGRVSWVQQASVALGLGAIGLCVAGLTALPVADFRSRAAAAVTDTQSADLRNALAAAPSGVRTAAWGGSLVQLAGYPMATEFETGLETAAAFGNADDVAGSATLARIQCEALAERRPAYVLFLPEFVGFMKEQEACTSLLDFGSALSIGTARPDGRGVFVVVRRH